MTQHNHRSWHVLSNIIQDKVEEIVSRIEDRRLQHCNDIKNYIIPDPSILSGDLPWLKPQMPSKGPILGVSLTQVECQKVPTYRSVT